MRERENIRFFLPSERKFIRYFPFPLNLLHRHQSKSHRVLLYDFLWIFGKSHIFCKVLNSYFAIKIASVKGGFKRLFSLFFLSSAVFFFSKFFLKGEFLELKSPLIPQSLSSPTLSSLCTG